MKIFRLFICIFATILSVSACSPDEYEQANIELSPVYVLTNLIGINPPYKVTIYEETKKMMVWQDDKKVLGYRMLNYGDGSEDDNYQISFVAVKDDVYYEYDVLGTVSSGKGQMFVQALAEDGMTPVGDPVIYTMDITEDEMFIEK